jgi:hypothetical protein
MIRRTLEAFRLGLGHGLWPRTGAEGGTWTPHWVWTHKGYNSAYQAGLRAGSRLLKVHVISAVFA